MAVVVSANLYLAVCNVGQQADEFRRVLVCCGCGPGVEVLLCPGTWRIRLVVSPSRAGFVVLGSSTSRMTSVEASIGQDPLAAVRMVRDSYDAHPGPVACCKRWRSSLGLRSIR